MRITGTAQRTIWGLALTTPSPETTSLVLSASSQLPKPGLSSQLPCLPAHWGEPPAQLTRSGQRLTSVPLSASSRLPSLLSSFSFLPPPPALILRFYSVFQGSVLGSLHKTCFWALWLPPRELEPVLPPGPPSRARDAVKRSDAHRLRPAVQRAPPIEVNSPHSSSFQLALAHRAQTRSPSDFCRRLHICCTALNLRRERAQTRSLFSRAWGSPSKQPFLPAVKP